MFCPSVHELPCPMASNERAVHVLGPIAAAVRLERLQVLEDLIEIIAQIVEARHIDVAAIAIGDQADAQRSNSGLAAADELRERPDSSASRRR